MATRHKYKELDALRWLAAFSVGMGHAFLCVMVDGNVPKIPHVLGTMLFNGAYAVDLFFVLSGFVLINATKSRGILAYLGFLARRALRIYPSAWMSLSIAVAALVIAHRLSGYHSSWVSPWIDSLLGVPALNVLNVVGVLLLSNYAVNTTLWTIAIELAASAAYPFFVPLVKSRKVALAICLTIVAVIASKYIAGGMALRHVGHFLYMFMIGACLNFLRPIKAVKWRNFAIFVSVGLMFCARLYGQRHQFGSDIISVTGAAILIAGIAFWCPPWLERFLSGNILGNLGRASYSYYLINPSVTFVLVKGAQLLPFPGPADAIQYVAYCLTLGAVATALTVPLSLVSARYIENASINLGRAVEKRILSGRREGQDSSVPS